MSDETRIRERAYAIWEREGRPEGAHDSHWDRAARELVAEGRAVAEVEPTAQPAEADGEAKGLRPASARTPKKSPAAKVSDGDATPAEATLAPDEAGAPVRKRRTPTKR